MCPDEEHIQKSTPGFKRRIQIFILLFVGIYVMCATREDDVSPRWRYASEDVNLYSRNSAHGHQTKGGRSCADGMRST